jgi:AcrR family transcriptional regulator
MSSGGAAGASARTTGASTVDGGAGKLDGRAVRGEATRLRILDAARDMLVERGYGGTSTRAVAERAETQLSLVHYHFGGKQQLLAAVLERQNEQLLERQRRLYSAPDPFSQKWRTACSFLDDDVKSGYVRVLWELWAAGLADPELAARWRAAMRGWRHLLASVFSDWAAELEVELPAPPTVLASLVANIFEGIEIELLAGVPERDAPHHEALEWIGSLIEQAEGRAR